MVTFFWYFMCCGFVSFVLIVAAVLIATGDRKRKKAQLEANAQRDAEAIDG